MFLALFSPFRLTAADAEKQSLERERGVSKLVERLKLDQQGETGSGDERHGPDQMKVDPGLS